MGQRLVLNPKFLTNVVGLFQSFVFMQYSEVCFFIRSGNYKELKEP